MGTIKEALTFDDVTLVPQYSAVLPFETITKTELNKNLKLDWITNLNYFIIKFQIYEGVLK